MLIGSGHFMNEGAGALQRRASQSVTCWSQVQPMSGLLKLCISSMFSDIRRDILDHIQW